MRLPPLISVATLAACVSIAARAQESVEQWTPFSGGQARLDAAAVWTGSEMLVWGNLATGMRHNPVTGSFANMSAGNQPPVRNRASALWTGSEMIVWGGYVQSGQTYSYPAQGGLYNPATNTWRLMSTSGFNAGRLGHSAVWTGTELIIWGGNSGGDVLNSGARYNPATNRWTSLPVTGGPGPREGHTAVWTGTEMIIWGGNSNLGLYDIGVRFNPSTGAWTAISANGAPSPRTDHTAVWTGTEMIVWGGRGFGEVLNTGGRYNPATNTWTPITISDAPSKRWLHTALWTGSEMIIWGGSVVYPSSTTAVSLTTTGARYNPATDAWTPMTTTNAPSARYRHHAVWTGSEMIVWGGNTGAATNTGGRYSPGPPPPGGGDGGHAEFASWQMAFFGSTTAPGAGPSEDPDGDGLENLLEYAFNLDPLTPGTPVLVPDAGTSGLPLIREELVDDFRFLTAEFIRRKNGGEWTVQTSETLDDWTDANVTDMGVTSVSQNYERVKVRINPVLRPGGRRFVRLSVTLQ